MVAAAVHGFLLAVRYTADHPSRPWDFDCCREFRMVADNFACYRIRIPAVHGMGVMEI